LVRRLFCFERRRASFQPASHGSMSGTPGGHKLTNVEAQRIMAILEETYSKLDLMSKVPPLQLPDEDALRSVLGPDVLQLLQEQVVLEQQYEWVSAPQSEQKPDHDGELPDFETLDDDSDTQRAWCAACCARLRASWRGCRRHLRCMRWTLSPQPP